MDGSKSSCQVCKIVFEIGDDTIQLCKKQHRVHLKCKKKNTKCYCKSKSKRKKILIRK